METFPPIMETQADICTVYAVPSLFKTQYILEDRATFLSGYFINLAFAMYAYIATYTNHSFS